jgi:hypothetical protein
MVRELSRAGLGVTDGLRRAGPALQGEPLDIGDVGFSFTLLPRVRAALTAWEGDDEFPSQATVLFEDTAANYMPTDGLAILGSQLVDRALAAAVAQQA